MDWRESGEKIKALVNQERQRTIDFLTPKLQEVKEEFSFVLAVAAFAQEGQREPLVTWLRSDRIISTLEREVLADLLETGLRPPKTRRGRPRRQQVHDAAQAALLYYRAWREFNEANGIDDFGYRSLMQDEAVRMALGHELWVQTDPEEVRELMERPRSRRK